MANSVSSFSFLIVGFQDLAAAALFLAGKVEEFPRKLEHLVKVSYALQHRDEPPLDISSDVSDSLFDCVKYATMAHFPLFSQKYLDEAQKIVMYENLLLTTLGTGKVTHQWFH